VFLYDKTNDKIVQNDLVVGLVMRMLMFTELYNMTAQNNLPRTQYHGSNIYYKRKECGLTQEVVAARSGISQSYLSRLERELVPISDELYHLLMSNCN